MNEIKELETNNLEKENNKLKNIIKQYLRVLNTLMNMAMSIG